MSSPYAPHPRPRPRPPAVLGSTLAVAGVAALQAMAGSPAGAQEVYETPDGYSYELSARIWYDRGHEPLVERGDRVRVYYRASADAYVAIFNIDTNGTVRLVYPRSPEENHYVRGGRDYRLLFPRSPYWLVDDAPGIGYYFIVASPEPFDFSRFAYSHYGAGWDLTRVGRSVYRDPYVAMDDYVATLVPDWEYTPYALDFASYDVGRERHDYPRFLCYDCHGFRSYQSWNPYHYACTSFRVVIYDDPYYYPAHRYRNDRLVYAGLPIRRLPRFEFKERAGDEPPEPLIATRATDGRAQPRPGVPEVPLRRSVDGDGSEGSRTGREAVRRSGETAGDAARGGVTGSGADAGVSRRGSGGSVGAGSDAGVDRRSGAGAGGQDRRIIRGSGVERGGSSGDAGERRYVPVVSPRRSDEGGAAGGGDGEARRPTPRRYVPVIEARERPVLRRRGEEGGDAGGAVRTPARTGEGDGAAGAASGTTRRPTDRILPGRGADGRSGGAAVRSPARGGTGSAATRGGASGSTSGASRPPVIRRGGAASDGSARTPVRIDRSGRSGSGGGDVRPPVRVKRSGGSASGGAGSAKVRRSGGSGGSAGSAKVRRSGGSGSSGGSARVRRSGGSGSSGGSAKVRRSGGTGSSGGSARARGSSGSSGSAGVRRSGGSGTGGSAQVRRSGGSPPGVAPVV